MVFDGIFSFAGNDDDVLDSGSDALFGDVLNLRLVDDGEHFFRLRLGGGEEARAKSRGREDSFADFVAAAGGAASMRKVGYVRSVAVHRLSFLHTSTRGWTPFFDVDSIQSMFLRSNGARWVSWSLWSCPMQGRACARIG